jgi:hypothetical protein
MYHDNNNIVELHELINVIIIMIHVTDQCYYCHDTCN